MCDNYYPCLYYLYSILYLQIHVFFTYLRPNHVSDNDIKVTNTELIIRHLIAPLMTTHNIKRLIQNQRIMIGNKFIN